MCAGTSGYAHLGSPRDSLGERAINSGLDRGKQGTRNCEEPCPICPVFFSFGKKNAGLLACSPTYTVATNADGFIPDVPADLVLVMKCCTAVTWFCWVLSVSSIAMKPKKA